MKVLVTGAGGFIGKNLIAELKLNSSIEVFEYDIDTPIDMLDEFCRECNFVYNLAGVNRPENTDEFFEGNCGFAALLIEKLKKYSNNCPIMNSSSIQAKLDNPYGKSKKAGEEMLLDYGRKSGAQIYIYRFSNVFGKWCRPNYNSVVATFCNNIARDIPIQINDRNTVLHLIYIDDLVRELLLALDGKPHLNAEGYGYVPTEHEITLGCIADLLYSFKNSRESKLIPYMAEGSFEKKLYSTYLSYLPTDKFAYPLDMHTDHRGSFTEIIKSLDRGQVSVNISKPGVTKGNHWHHSKNEKFIVVSGKGLIRFRQYGREEIIDYHVSGEKLQVVDIPTGYVHSIINEGDTDLVTIMWCNECYNPDNSDTMREDVIKKGEE